MEMISNYIKVAFRSISRHRLFSLVNLCGLAIGIAVAVLIFQYASFELSYDSFSQSDRMYRIENNYIRRGNLIYNSAGTFSGVAPSLKSTLPAVEEYARLYPGGDERESMLNYVDEGGRFKVFKESKLFYADGSILELFEVPMVYGNQGSALKEPNSIVLSATAAKRYFGERNPVDEVIRLTDGSQNTFDCTVTGVFKDLPQNRHVQFDVLVSYPTLYALDGGISRYREAWKYSASFYTYLLLSPDADPASIVRHTQRLLDQFNPILLETNEAGERIRKFEFTLQPVRDIHLYSHRQNEIQANGNGNVVTFFMIVAFLILLIAWINYINMATARSVERMKEVGVRKVLGSSRSQLVIQFIFESLLINLGAVLVALLLVEVAQPFISDIFGQPIPSLWNYTYVWSGLAGVIIIGSILSGTYPAFIVSSFRPISALKQQVSNLGGGVWARKFLVVFQFASAIGLIIATYVVLNQFNYMHGKELGFDMEQVLVVEGPITEEERSRYEVFKNQINGYQFVKSVAGSDVVPGQNILRGLASGRGPGSEIVSIEGNYVDYEFIDTYGMEILAGRNFSGDLSDSSAVIFNEDAITKLGFKSPQEAIGQEVYIASWPRSYEIVGVIRNYHQESLHRMYDPMFFEIDRNSDHAYFSIKIDARNLSDNIAHIENSYKAHFPGNPFNYFFLDDFFNAQYKADQTYIRLFSIFSFLAIFIACIGLMGLSTYVTVKRSKEIGIRKVLGASTGHILNILGREFMTLIIISILITVPLVYQGLQRWLEHYAFRIDLNLNLFVLPVVSVTSLVLLTIGVQIMKIARLDPVQSMKEE